MKKVYYLSTCSTCKRILKELDLDSEFILQDVKKEAINPNQLETLHKLSGSYESLFNRRSMLYRERDLKNQTLTEADYKNLILEHYSFLKRPVFIINQTIFIGNAKKNIVALKAHLS